MFSKNVTLCKRRTGACSLYCTLVWCTIVFYRNITNGCVSNVLETTISKNVINWRKIKEVAGSISLHKFWEQANLKKEADKENESPVSKLHCMSKGKSDNLDFMFGYCKWLIIMIIELSWRFLTLVFVRNLMQDSYSVVSAEQYSLEGQQNALLM